MKWKKILDTKTVKKTLKSEDKIKNENLITEMAHIVTKDDMMIWVWPTEGKNIPHFHIGGLNTGEKWRSTIKILKCEYFLHNGDVPLNSSQKKEMVKMLNGDASEDGGPFANYWQELVWQWNKVPGVTKIPLTTPMPPYRTGLPPLAGTKKKKTK